MCLFLQNGACGSSKVNIGSSKVNIGSSKVNIGSSKVTTPPCASTKGLPLVCPLVGFEGVCLCRLCLFETHWQKGFALRGALRGALRDFVCPNSNLVCLLSFHPTATIIFWCAFCANTTEEQTYMVASVLLTVCGKLGPINQRCCVSPEICMAKTCPCHRDLFWVAGLALVSTIPRDAPTFIQNVCQGFLNGRLGYSIFWP